MIESWKRFLKELFCVHYWDKTHSRNMASHEMNKCIYCGKIKDGHSLY